MKHLFYIHSPITLLSALSVIEEEKPKSWAFLCSFDFTPNLSYTQANVELYRLKKYQLSETSSSGSWRFFQNLVEIIHLRRFIRQITKDKFVLCLPHTKNFLMQCLIHLPKCDHFNIIDEGLLTYNHPNAFIKPFLKPITLQSKIKKYLTLPKHLNQSVSYGSQSAKHSHVYLFYESPFQDKNLGYKKIDFPSFPAMHLNYSNSSVFILDNAVEANLLSQEEYEDWLEGEITKRNLKSISVKFHPRQINKKAILNVFSKHKVNVQIIHDEVYLELVFRASINMKVYGLWSSLLFYAKMEGHEVVSGINRLQINNQLLANYIDNGIPGFFRNLLID